MYKAPIELITRDIVRQFVERVDGEVFNTVTQYGITVDKEDLLKALAYDREQYEKGYGDGYRVAKDEIVRCKDCKGFGREGEHPRYKTRMFCKNHRGLVTVSEDSFCSYGERRDDV